jgi:antitoxin HigA-1
VIKSFKDKEAVKIWNREYSRRLPNDIQERALMKLQQLHAAGELKDLLIPVSNQLEPLKGDLPGAIFADATASGSTSSGASASDGRTAMPRMWKSSTITESGGILMAARKLKLTHPGKILRAEFMEPVGLTAYALAKALEVPLPRVNDIVREKRGISPEMAVLLSAYFGSSDSYWINLQAHYDLEIAKERVGKHAARIQPHPHDASGALRPV